MMMMTIPPPGPPGSWTPPPVPHAMLFAREQIGMQLLPASAPSCVEEAGCPICGAAIHWGAFALRPGLGRAVCSRSARATRNHAEDARTGGITCRWFGWIVGWGNATVVIAHGEPLPDDEAVSAALAWLRRRVQP